MISIYIHIPFCIQKCGYCDFHSVATPIEKVPQDEYTAAVCEELTRQSKKYQLSGREVGSVYFGGGTPTMFAFKNIEIILNAIYKNFPATRSPEITLEANPETFKPSSVIARSPPAAGDEAIPLNQLDRHVGHSTSSWPPPTTAGRRDDNARLSIGVQTFNDHHLKKLGRVHSAETARQAVRSAQAGGCKNISIDLMWGLPNQTLEELKSDLNSAIELNVQHISAYQLTLNSNVGEGLRPLPNMAGTETRHTQDLPSDEQATEMFWIVHNTLTSAGFEHYEISNFAKPSFRSFHNENYWRYGEWLGLGSGATSFIKGEGTEPLPYVSGVRFTCSKDIAKYLKHDFVYGTEIIDKKTAMAEYSFLGLRTSLGIDLGDFQKRFGQNFDEIYPTLRNKWISRQLAIATSNGFALNPDGWLISDELFQEFV